MQSSEKRGEGRAERSEHWIASQVDKRVRKTHERRASPLILCGHGVSLRVENGALVIRDGLTHYPQDRVTHRFFRGDLGLPPRIVLLDGSGTLSFDVLSWLAEQGIALARVKADGTVAIVANGSGYAADRAKVDWQRATKNDAVKRLAFAADLISRKVEASLPTLSTYIPASKSRDMAIAKAEAGIGRLKQEAFSDINAIFAIEGECASAYFRSWHGLPVNWKGLQRQPVPQEWYAYNWRSSRATGVKPENRNASHPVNAMLNYASAVKLAQAQIQAVANGYDPMLGIMHNSHRGQSGLGTRHDRIGTRCR